MHIPKADGQIQGRNKLRNRIEVIRFVIMTSLCSTAASDCRTGKAKADIVRVASFLVVVVGQILL